MTLKHDFRKRMKREEIIKRCMGYATLDKKVKTCGRIEHQGKWYEPKELNNGAESYKKYSHVYCPDCLQLQLIALKIENEDRYRIKPNDI